MAGLFLIYWLFRLRYRGLPVYQIHSSSYVNIRISLEHNQMISSHKIKMYNLYATLVVLPWLILCGGLQYETRLTNKKIFKQSLNAAVLIGLM